MSSTSSRRCASLAGGADRRRRRRSRQRGGLKLVAVAEARAPPPLLTTDFNLNKVAAAHGIDVLNVNELAHAIGGGWASAAAEQETLTVTIVKEEGGGPEVRLPLELPFALVVVDQGRSVMGRTLPVVVTNSGLQTTAGKMFFAKLSGG